MASPGSGEDELEPVWYWQAFFLQEVAIEHLGLILRSTVAQYRDDGVARAHILRQTDGACDIHAG